MNLIVKNIEQKSVYQLIWLRGFAIFLQLIVLSSAQFILDISLPITPMLLIVAVYFIFHILIFWQYKQQKEVTEPILLMHLLLDVLILCCLLYFAGGATNPFISLLLFPLTITATMLSARYTWFIAIIVVISYSVLMRVHISLPHNHADGDEFSLHIWGMWFGFLLSAALVSFFIVSIRKLLEHKEQLLHNAREQNIRDKQLISLATLSASTAHELGTPLATIALLSDELYDELHEQPDTKQQDLINELVIPLKKQVVRCKEILSILSTTSGNVHLEGGKKLPVDQFIKKLVHSWKKGYLKSQLTVQYQGKQPAPDILAERLLNQAIINILDNAQKVSPDDISCLLVWNKKHIEFSIKDAGPGLEKDQLEHFGKSPFTNPNSDGMGLGSFLSYTIIERLGGKIKFSNRKSGGLIIQISLPIQFDLESNTSTQ